ncbi:ARF GAP with effector function(s) [Pleurotus ostreatus]|nr:ARF GAP with effector function(s) [Pleurotus ostreatus]
MSRQDKATTERFTKTLRELVKQPENKVCADCKRNDPRWASWNLGVFLCIRCSGIHRGMGTHISKVKSVDLDVWTPEQMESIQKWGNHRANLYWEAHLKAGHIPPDHKMESFIRSKYESRRWAMEGPPPRDPSTLDGGAPAPAAAPPPTFPIRTASPSHRTSASITNRHAVATNPTITPRQPGGHQLLSASHMNQPARSIAPPQTHPVTPSAPAQPAPPPQPQNDLFTLDFHAPSPTATSSGQSAQPKKDVKSDILSLFSSPAAPAATPAFNPQATSSFTPSPWGTPQQQQQPVAQQPGFVQTTSMMGSNGAGMWGVNSGWAAPAAPSQNNLWGNPGPAPAQTGFAVNPLANTNNVWAGSAAPNPGGDLFSTPFASTTTNTQKKDDVFGDLWGGFK